MQFKKGHISFLLFFIVCFILLYPLLFYRTPFPLWPSFIMKETFDNHVLQKRAFREIANDKFQEIKPILLASKKVKYLKEIINLVLPLPPILSKVISSVGDLVSSTEFRANFAKMHLMLSWLELLEKMDKASLYKMEIYCPSTTFSSLLSIEEEIITKIFGQFPKTPFFLYCYSLLEYIDGPPTSSGQIKVHSGFYISTSNKLLNSSASSPVQEFELT
ncbi:MAG: hypothetical protein N3D10_00180 [Candidatus Micrarchaeota archaeon]|nr:hypothetical protein [Candidatus Micrarchaeota archaeon]